MTAGVPRARSAEAVSAAKIAAEQFTLRRASASRRVADRRWTADEAEARLRPWLHLAAMAGADIPAVYEDTIHLFPYDKAGQPAQIPLVLSLTAADRAAALAELAASRDAAIVASEADPAKLPPARQLCELARHLGAPPIDPNLPRHDAVRAQAAAPLSPEASQ